MGFLNRLANLTVICHLLIVGEAVLFCHVANAGLGDLEDSIEKDRKMMSGNRHVAMIREAYTVHEIANEGMTIREYISSTGVVFGLSWNGVNHPDLSAWMGSFFGEFQKVSQQIVHQRGQRLHRVIAGSNIVVEKFGHMRATQGKAYVPSLVPAGVNPDEIR